MLDSMNNSKEEIIWSKCTQDNYNKLIALDNPDIFSFLEEYVKLCSPKSVFIRSDSPSDADYIRRMAIECKDERPLKIRGHTVHFDGIYDQARDKKRTKYLVSQSSGLSSNLNTTERKEGLEEIKAILKNSMLGKEMIVCFFGLGPLYSKFFIPCLQITDSFYVAHSEGILYRSAYKVFCETKPKSKDIFKFVHSAGETENSVSKNIDKRRVYIDLQDNIVFSANTQYAGNTVGLKKPALRLAINKASQEGWLAEHMFVMGVKSDNRTTYFCGAYPSGCGKTSTAMLKGEAIIGDDIAHLRNIDGVVRAVNAEHGAFGIIRDVNSESDPVIWEVLTTEGEVIFSNVLVSEDGVPFWIGDGRDTPSKGYNFSGEWYQGKIDDLGSEIPFAHKNARYTIELERLENCSSKLDEPMGVEVGGIVYGGRDSDTWPPVQQAFDWVHGVITMGASLESETTAATIGKEGIRMFNLMSNMDFLSIPIEKYIANYIDFAKKLVKVPAIFSVNYFLRNDDGVYLSSIEDKRVWFRWMELRIHNEVEALETPTGLIPKYEDLKELFKRYLGKEYTKDKYEEEFTLRIPENISKIERIVNIYHDNAPKVPELLFNTLYEQRERLENFMRIYGKYVSPFSLEKS